MWKERDFLYNNFKWPEPNKQQENQLLRKCPESNWWLRRLLGNLPQSQPVSRSPTDSNQEQLPFEKSGNIRNLPTSWSGSYPSKEWWEKSPMNGNKNWDSNHPPCLPSKKPPKPTWSPCSKIPTCVPSMLKESPSWQEIFSWPRESEEIGSDLINAPLSIYTLFILILKLHQMSLLNLTQSTGFDSSSIPSLSPPCVLKFFSVKLNISFFFNLLFWLADFTEWYLLLRGIPSSLSYNWQAKFITVFTLRSHLKSQCFPSSFLLVGWESILNSDGLFFDFSLLREGPGDQGNIWYSRG